MSVRDQRRPSFAWIALSALDRVKQDLPESRQPGARNALLALAEAASRRRDGHHEHGDTLKDLAAAARLSTKRLRDHLRDLERIGLVRILEARDDRGRDLPSVYVLLDGGDESSHRGDGRRNETSPDLSPPTRTRLNREEEEQKHPPSPPPQAGGRSNPRTLGTNPRAMAARRQREDSLAAMSAPTSQDYATWESICRDVRSTVFEGAWNLYLTHLRLAGADRGVLVIDVESKLRHCLDRYRRILVDAASRHGAQVRLATDDEHEALAIREEAA
jgi:hypothetical protein